MPNYHQMAETYRPRKIRYLLVGEAPPPSGVYFYAPMKLALGAKIENDTSLPSTIFNHYFNRRPESDREYSSFLFALKKRGIFLVDIVDEPIKVSDRSFPGWVNPSNLEIVREGIFTLRQRLKKRGIVVPENQIIFLLARRHYEKDIRSEFPLASRIRWKDFRTKIKVCPCCEKEQL